MRSIALLLALSLTSVARAQDGSGSGSEAGSGSAAASDKDSAVPSHQKHDLDTAKPALHGKDGELKVGDATEKAYAAHPKGKQKGAVLVLHEWWGLNDWIKHEADQLAAHGYLALAVDLYQGKIATDPKQAGELMGKLDQAHAKAVEEAGMEWLKNEGKVAKVATIGWCMGGGQSLNASLADPKDVWATVIYYGMPVDDVDKLKTLQGPVLGVWANKDGWITPDKVKAFGEALTKAGIKHEFHAYDADHAFANPSNGEKYKKHDAADAWKKTLHFLDSHAPKS